MTNKFFFLIFGAFFLYFGVRSLIIYFKDQRREYDIVDGKVIELRKSLRHDAEMGNMTSYTPIFEYRYNGVTYQKEHRVSSAKYGKRLKIVPASKYQVGDIVSLRVYADEPEFALVDDKNNIRMPLYFGVPFTIAGIIFLVVTILKMLGKL